MKKTSRTISELDYNSKLKLAYSALKNFNIYQHEKEEVVQNAIIKLEAYEDMPFAFLRRTVINLAINYRRDRVSYDEYGLRYISFSEKDSRMVTNMEKIEAYEAYYSRLDKKKQDALTCIIRGYSTEEMQQKLNISRDAVHSLTYRTRKEIRKIANERNMGYLIK